MYDVSIIGAGIVGSSIARELSKYKLRVCLIEKEEDVACCNRSIKSKQRYRTWRICS
nr:FAD-dependent oxidoreductase [Clostridium botulinum]